MQKNEGVCGRKGKNRKACRARQENTIQVISKHLGERWSKERCGGDGRRLLCFAAKTINPCRRTVALWSLGLFGGAKAVFVQSLNALHKNARVPVVQQCDFCCLSGTFRKLQPNARPCYRFQCFAIRVELCSRYFLKFAYSDLYSKTKWTSYSYL